MKVIAGIGCDRDVSLKTLQEALTQALTACALDISRIAGLASIDKKQDEPALRLLAAENGWPLYFYPAEALAQVPAPNPSAVVLKYMGTPTVAEAAALLAAHAGIEDLLVEKYKYLGTDGKNATVSIARIK
ncbi:MAG: cobalamin biosynthesis protein [Methylomonas sp.]|jgi:cobalt-precorrin 5A hydrolase